MTPRGTPVRSLLFAVLAVGTACAPAADKPDSTMPATDAPRVAERMVSILSPADGDTVVGAEVKITLGATGVTIEKAAGTHVEGVGHHHLFLDDDVSPAGAPIPLPTAKIIHIGTGATEYTFTGVAPGTHRIIAVIGHGDHVPMADAKADTINIVVRK